MHDDAAVTCTKTLANSAHEIILPTADTYTTPGAPETHTGYPATVHETGRDRVGAEGAVDGNAEGFACPPSNVQFRIGLCHGTENVLHPSKYMSLYTLNAGP